MKFLKGGRDEFAKLTDGDYGERSEIVRRNFAEVFGSKNLSFLIGSGCSSLVQDGAELGIPTMGPLAQEFQATFKIPAGLPPVVSYVTGAQKKALHEKLGIDLTHIDFQRNLERLMEVLMTAHQFCKTSGKKEFQDALTTVEAVIAGIKRFILQKCTEGRFTQGDNTAVTLYRRFYQSLQGNRVWPKSSLTC